MARSRQLDGAPRYYGPEIEHVDQLASACGGVKGAIDAAHMVSDETRFAEAQSGRRGRAEVLSEYRFSTGTAARDFVQRVNRARKGKNWADATGGPKNRVVVWRINMPLYA